MPPKFTEESPLYIQVKSTDLGIIERETHAVVGQDAGISLHSSNCHLCSHSEPPGPHPSVTGEKPHQIQWSLVGTAKWTANLQIRVVCTVPLIAKIEGER